MSTEVEDLWPVEIEKEVMITPASILREQAAVLSRRTKGLIEGAVSTTAAKNGRILHSFDLVAPALDDYHYELFRISHPVTLYPIEIDYDATRPPRPYEVSDAFARIFPPRGLQSEEQFKDWLKETFASQHTQRVVSALLAQSKS